MKMILFHCREIKTHSKTEEKKWAQALFALICPTTKDTVYSLSKGMKEIQRTLEYLKEKNLVILPFPYLDKSPITKTEMKRDVNKIALSLMNSGASVSVIDTDKIESFYFDLLGHKTSVGFRST